MRAYLDAILPDGTPRRDFARALKAFADDLCELPKPVAVDYGQVTVRFGTEIALEASKADHLRMLSGSLRELCDEHAVTKDND